jgi:hypothetical protein
MQVSLNYFKNNKGRDTPCMDFLATVLKAPVHRNLLILTNLLPYIDNPGRKDIMTLIRMQCTPTTHYSIRKSLSTLNRTYIDRSTNSAFYIEFHVVPLLDTFIFSPILCGFVSMLLRQIPYEDPTHLSELRTEAIWKEINATKGPDRPQSLDYTCLFASHPDSIHTPLSVYTDAQPTLSTEQRNLMTRWKIELSDKVLLPTIGKKTVGVESSTNFWRQQGIPLRDLPNMPSVSPQELERMYSESGCTVEGPVEVRVAFKFNDLKPRVYYCIGATAYFAARYIHDISDSFQRLFPSTHPSFRHDPLRIDPLEDDDLLFIYDYTSFTSNLAELKYFLDALSSFCVGTSVRLLDTHFGIVSYDLGQLIREYNTIVNIDSEFDIGPILRVGYPLILQSAKSGLLGVYGNIVWSLSLHGVHLCHLCGSNDRCNCVGDDAEGRMTKERGKEAQSRLVSGVRMLGDISEEKMRWWLEDSKEPYRAGHHYIKRPIDRLDGHVWTKPMIDFPSLSLLCDIGSEYHTVPFEDKTKRTRKFIIQTCRFFDRLNSQFERYLSEADGPIIFDYLRAAYRRLDIPPHGAVPGQLTDEKHRSFRDLAIPALRMETLVDWRRVLFDNFGTECCLLLMPMTDDIDDLQYGFKEGDMMNLHSNRILGVLEALGFVERRKARREMVFNARIQYEVFCSLLDGTLPVSYVYHCLRDSPFWLRDYLYTQIA